MNFLKGCTQAFGICSFFALLLAVATVHVQGQPSRGGQTEFEVGENSGELHLPLKRPSYLTGDLLYSVVLRPLTAHVGIDVMPLPTEVLIPSGQEQVEVALELIDNTRVDGDRSLEIEWGSPEGDRMISTVWIRDDEQALVFDPSYGEIERREVPLAFGEDGIIYAGCRGNLLRLDADGRLDADFQLQGFEQEPRPGAYQDISDVLVTPEGDLLVGVTYEYYGPTSPVMYSWIQRYHSDGTPVEDFAQTRLRADYIVDLLLQPDGSVIYTGFQENFQTGSSTVRLGRVLPKGGIDSSFDSDRVFAGHEGDIFKLGRQSDGGILVAGRFDHFNRTEKMALVRLAANGSIDPEFESSLLDGSSIRDLVVLPDGRMLIAGNLVVDDGEPRRLLRLDQRGEIDWDYGASDLVIDSQLVSLVVDSDRNWLYGFGDFSKVNDQPRHGLLRLELSTGRLDDLNVQIDRRNGSLGKHIGVQASGHLFTSRGRIWTDQIDRQSARFLEPHYQSSEVSEEELSIDVQRLGSSSRPYTAFLSVTSTGKQEIDFKAFPERLEFGEGVTRLSLPFCPIDNGKLNGSLQIKLSLTDGDGQLLESFMPRTEIAVHDNEIPNRLDAEFSVAEPIALNAFESLSDGRIVVGTRIEENPVLLLRSNGRVDPGFSAFGIFPSRARVNVFKEQDDRWVVAGGWADDARGTRRPMITRFDSRTGQLDDSFVPSRLLNSRQGSGQVTAIALQPVGGEIRLVLAGDIRSGGRRDGVVRLLLDGTLDSTFGNGVGIRNNSGGFEIRVLLTLPDGGLLVGGRFDTIDETSSPGLGLLKSDGQVNETFRSPFRENDQVLGAAIDNEGRIVVAVRFHDSAETVIRLLPDGSIDEQFEPVEVRSGIDSLALDSIGRTYLFGHFETVDGAFFPRMARLLEDGALDTAFWSTRASSDRIRRGQILGDGSLLIGIEGNLFDEQHVNSLFRFHPGTDAERTSVVFDQNSANRSLSEAHSETGSEFKLLRLGASETALPVSLRMILEGARPGLDFALDGRPIGFAPLAVESTFGVSVIDDGQLESGEAVKFQIDGVPTQPSQSTATFTIEDDEVPSIVDYDFRAGSGPNSTPNVMAQLPDGKMLLGGRFDQYDGVVVPPLIRVHPDGTLDETFRLAEAFSGRVESLLVLEDVIWVGGSFEYGDPALGPQRNLIRIGVDGESMPEVNALPVSDGAVRVIELAPDGSILVGGEFRRLGSIRRNSLAKLNRDGTIDESFPGLRVVFHGLNAIEPLGDGRIFLGGNQLTIGADEWGALVRLNEDGSLDSSFRSAIRGVVNDILALDGGGVIVGGSIWNVAGESWNGLVKLTEAGRVDPAFNLELVSGDVRRIIREGDQLLLAGSFQTMNNRPTAALVWITEDGEVSREFPGLGASIYLGVQDVLMDLEGRPVVASHSLQIGGIQTGSFLRLNTGDQSQPTLNLIPPTAVLSEPNGVLDISVRRIGDLRGSSQATIRLRSNSPEVDNNVRLVDDTVDFKALERTTTVQIEAVDDELLEPDGWFTLELTQVSRGTVVGSGSAVVRLLDDDREGSLVSEFRPRIEQEDYYGYGFLSNRRGSFGSFGDSFRDAEVWALAVQQDGRILIAGNFCRIDDVEIEGLARLHPNGDLDRSYQPRLISSAVERMALQSDDRLVYVNQGEGPDRLVRLLKDGQPDPSFEALAIESGGRIEGLLVLPDDRIVIWGQLSVWEHLGGDRLAVLLPDGKVDPHFDSGRGLNRALYDVQFQTPDHLLLVGGFSSYDQSAVRGLARIRSNGELDSNFSPLGGPNRDVNRLNVLGNGWLQIEGDFSQVDGVSQRFNAMLDSEGVLLVEESSRSVFVQTLALPSGESYTVRDEWEVGRHWLPLERMDRSGAIDPRFDSGESIEGSVRAMALLPGGDILVAGNLRSYNGLPVSSLIRIRGRFEMRLSSISRTAEGLTRVDLKVQPGHEYHLEFSQDMGQWERRASSLAEAAEISLWDEEQSSTGFYRVIQE